MKLQAKLLSAAAQPRRHFANCIELSVAVNNKFREACDSLNSGNGQRVRTRQGWRRAIYTIIIYIHNIYTYYIILIIYIAFILAVSAVKNNFFLCK